jgi:hypothetical protein
MQTNGLSLASGMPRLGSGKTTQRSLDLNKGTKMSDITSLRLAPSASLFSRFMATIDRLLMASAVIANRNNEPPYFGL